MMADVPDPFREHRRTSGVMGLPTDREVIPMILRHEDVRKAAKDWKTFSSDAAFRVPIPSEEHLRPVRQLPIEFALPLQSRALTVLLDVPESEAERFIAWGVHVFHGEKGLEQAAELERYLDEQFDKAAAAAGDDFYGVLTKASFHGRPLTRIDLLSKRDRVEHTTAYDRPLGYDSLVVRFHPPGGR